MASESASSAARAPRADAQRNRVKLVDAAQQLLARDGLDAEMVAIARTAGVGVGTLYRHFPARADLVDAVLERQHLDLAADARATAAGDDPGVGFTTFMAHLAETLAANVALADDAAMRRPGDWRPYNQELADAIGELLAAAQRAGSIRADVTTADVVGLIVGVARGLGDGRDAWRRRLGIVLDGLRTTTAQEASVTDRAAPTRRRRST